MVSKLKLEVVVVD